LRSAACCRLFYQAYSAATVFPKPAGGLGLCVAWEIALPHMGRLWVEHILAACASLHYR